MVYGYIEYVGRYDFSFPETHPSTSFHARAAQAELIVSQSLLRIQIPHLQSPAGHQSPRGQFSFPAHGKVPEGPLPSASMPLLTTCTTTLLAFPSAACFWIPSPLYPNPVPFPATPLPPRHVQLVARTTAMFSHRLPPRPTDPLNLSARFPVNKEDTTRIAHHSILDHSHTLYSALLWELASRFSASRVLDLGRTQRAPPIGACPFRA
jgi:hypothetical protein